MKTLRLLVPLLLAAPAVGADRSFPPPSSFESFVLELPPGSSPAAVQKVLGAPAATLGTDLWIYWNFTGPNPNAGNPAYDTLVVAFSKGRVSDVKITDGRTVRRLLAEAAQFAAKEKSGRHAAR